MLPGCATVVLETVVAIQSFAVNKVSQALRASVSDNQKSQRFTIKYEYYFVMTNGSCVSGTFIMVLSFTAGSR